MTMDLGREAASPGHSAGEDERRGQSSFAEEEPPNNYSTNGAGPNPNKLSPKQIADLFRPKRDEAPKLRIVPTEPIWGSIPTELTSLPRWVLRKAKIPKQLSGAGASSTDPATWTTFDEVKAAYLAGGFDGIGIVLSGDDDLACWDFDHCLDADGRITDPKIEAYVERLASYTEVSPSGTGLHVFVRGKLPPQGRKNGPCEVYESKRYMTATGRRFGNTPATVNECQEAIDQVHAAIFGEPAAAPEREEAKSPTREDAEILRKARGAANSDKLEALLAGEWCINRRSSPQGNEVKPRHAVRSARELRKPAHVQPAI